MSCPILMQQTIEHGPQMAEKQTQHHHDHLEEIPQPPQHLFGLLGNIPDIDPSFMFKDVWRLQKIYGPIMKLKLGTDRVFIGSQALVHEVCDPTRFGKIPTGAMIEVRGLVGDGLFTAFTEEPNWGLAHRLLVPTFGPLGIRKMWHGMQDIASQMILKWDRLGPDHEIECSDDLTRLAFDTIGLCACSYRFNQFYLDEIHPFAQQMSDYLLESGKKSARPPLARFLRRPAEHHRQQNITAMHALCDEIVASRKKHPQPENDDLLNVMLNSKDRETGQGLSDENIRFQLATFLIAGHETSSATLSFTYYNLLKNPGVLLKAQRIIDEVVGDEPLSVKHIPKLEYIDACIKETLRLSSPLTGSTLTSKTDQVIGGKYHIPALTPVTINNQALHCDPLAWGDDADLFMPERWLDDRRSRLPPDSWKPFGTGIRACIGRAFAEQEMIMNISMVLQRFHIELADPSYQLQLKSTLTIKPINFRMKVRRRQRHSVEIGVPVVAHSNGKVRSSSAPSAKLNRHGKPLAVFFGGNSGTCESLAQSLQAAATRYGYNVSIASLDSATENIPTDREVVFIVASYEGQAPDNAKKFVLWLEELRTKSLPLKDVKYSVFGCGSSDWASTYHRIPRLINKLVRNAGGTCILNAGYTNVKTDLIGPWEDWLEDLIAVLTNDLKIEQPHSNVEVLIQPRSAVSPGIEKATYGTVMVNRELAGTEVGLAKRHLEIELPNDVHYDAGDYLVVQPCNPPASVYRVASMFDLDELDTFSVVGPTKRFLPTTPTEVGAFLSSIVELAAPITIRQLETIADHAPDERKEELKLLRKDYAAVLEKRFSIVDVLESLDVQMPFAEFVDMLTPLKPRRYSIASSALASPGVASLTIDVHESPALSGHGQFQGVCSTYLASRRLGDRVPCFIQPTQCGFRLPPPHIPLIMVAAGTGIAPMRAFLEERAAIAEAQGVGALGPAVLFFGCRDQSKDFIYQDKLISWQRQGIVLVRAAFSRMADREHRYAPDLIWEHREEVSKMFQDGGKIFLCGSAAKLGNSTADVCKKIWMTATAKGEDEAGMWLQSVKSDRYVSDVY